MLLSLYIDNFRSFDQGETFSLIANKKLNQGKDERHLIDLPQGNAQALRMGVLYGSNGAGKSNLFKALLLLQNLVNSDNDTKTTRWSNFALAKNEREFGQIDIQLLSKGEIYNYGLVLNNNEIKEEWLTAGTGDKNRIIFERVSDGNKEGAVAKITLGYNGKKQSNTKYSKKVEALVTLGVKPTRTFLSTYQEFISEGKDDHSDLRAVLDWFRNKLTLVEPDSQFSALHSFLYNSPDFKKFVTNYLKGVSTGLDDVVAHKEKMPISKLSNYFPQSALADLESIQMRSMQLDLPNGDEISLEAGQDTFEYSKLLSIHKVKGKKDIVAFPINLESDGTKRLMHLVPTLFPNTDPEAVFFIDELDRSLHPNLCYHFVETFLEQSVNTRKQLIITTHESNLLDQDLLRRDEIWFVEKDTEKCSHLYSLVDFQPRKDLDLKKNYLRGRFGAIPFFSNLETPTDEKSPKA